MYYVIVAYQDAPHAQAAVRDALVHIAEAPGAM